GGSSGGRPNLARNEGTAGRRERKRGDGASSRVRPGGIKASAIFLALGLALEVAATVWAFQLSVDAGALEEDPDCSFDGALFQRHASLEVQEECEELGEDDATALGDDGSYFVTGDGYAFCDLTEENTASASASSTAAAAAAAATTTAEDRKDDGKTFLDLCSCESEESDLPTQCVQVALSSSSTAAAADDACYARAVDPESSYALISASSGYHKCWATSPTGGEGLAVTALVIALVGQAAEAGAGVLRVLEPLRRGTSAIATAVAVFQALGVLATGAVLAYVAGGFGDGGGDDPLISALVAAVIAVIAGVVMDGVHAASERVRGALPCLEAFGNALLWIGVATLEVLVVGYFVWQAAGDGELRSWEVLEAEVAGLLAVEALGLVALWAARVLWTRAKLLAAVEGREGPNRRESGRFGRFDSV
ncbi:unnamed protein product, partial [Scytosiphon promiscuus]